MDRLEKAIEKSRLQRSSLERTFAGRPISPYMGTTAATDHSFPPATSVPETHEHKYEENRIIAHHTQSPVADVYRHLRTKVLHIMREKGYRTLAITSPRYGDGKTTVAVNLGISIALDVKQTVLMVDLDLRKPNLHQYLGMEAKAGITNYLLQDAPVHECMIRPPFERINILPSGTALHNSSEIIGSPKMIALASELKSRYSDRLVIYDLPPALAQDDPIAFLPHVDAVLVVVRDGVTSAQDLKRCLKTLAGANVIGTVLNNCW